MTLAYRIVDWKAKYEVTSKGKPANADTPDSELRKSKLTYIRRRGEGYNLSPTYRKITKMAWDYGILMDAACMGIFDMLVDLAKEWDDYRLRGWILGEKKNPITAPQIAEILDIRDDGTFEKLVKILCHEEINRVKLAEFPPAPRTEGEEGGEKGEERGEVGKPFLNETETECVEDLNNETERATPERPEQGGNVSPAPRPALVADSVSEISVTDSDSAPGGGQGIKKRRAQAFLQLCDKIIRPRDSSDRTTFRDIFDQLEQRMIYDTDEPLFEKALEKARECCLVGKVPAAMFTEAMKQPPFCYVPVGRSTIRGRKDEYRKS